MAVLRYKREIIENFIKIELKKIEDILNNLGFPVEYENEEVLIEITPNKPELYSLEGIRRLIYLYLNKKTAENYKINESNYNIVYKEVIKDRPYFLAGVVKNIKDTYYLYESIIELQEKLSEILGRKRKKIAIGIHDLNKIKFPIEYKIIKEGSFIPLGFDKKMSIKEILKNHPKGKLYGHLIKEYPVFVDKEGVISLPPIINSERRKITEKTKDFFIEITGNNKKTIEIAMNIILTSLYERGGELYHVKINGEETLNLEYKKIDVNYEEINKILGINLEKKEINKILEKMGYKINNNNIFYPPYRSDIIDNTDIIEDVAIIYGYNNFKTKMIERQTIGYINEKDKKIKKIFTNMKFLEVKNFFLTNKKTKLKILNPRNELFTNVRDSLFDYLILNLKENKDEKLPLKLFELDKIFKNNKEKKYLGFVIMDREININKGIAILKTLEKEGFSFEFKKINNKKFIKNRCYSIYSNNKEIGVIGEIWPEILIKNKIMNPIVFCEFEVREG